MELSVEQNPYGVAPGQIWQDRHGKRLIVDAIERRTQRGRAGFVAACVREDTGIRVHPGLTSFKGKLHSGYRRVND